MTRPCLLPMQLVLDSHRWVPLPAVGFPASTIGEESQEDVTPPSYLMEHPPLAVFVNGMSDICFIYCEMVLQVVCRKLVKRLYGTKKSMKEGTVQLCSAFI